MLSSLLGGIAFFSESSALAREATQKDVKITKSVFMFLNIQANVKRHGAPQAIPVLCLVLGLLFRHELALYVLMNQSSDQCLVWEALLGGLPLNTQKIMTA